MWSKLVVINTTVCLFIYLFYFIIIIIIFIYLFIFYYFFYFIFFWGGGILNLCLIMYLLSILFTPEYQICTRG